MASIQKPSNEKRQRHGIVTGTWRDMGYVPARSGAPSAKRLLVSGIALCALVALLAYGISVVNNLKSDDVPGTDLTKYQAQTPAQKADAAAFNGDYDQGMRILDEASRNEREPVKYAQLQLDKSLIAYNHSRPEESLQYAREAERIAPGVISAIAIATAAEALGDKQLAIEMYKKTLERYASEGGGTPDDIKHYQGKIDELSE